MIRPELARLRLTSEVSRTVPRGKARPPARGAREGFGVSSAERADASGEEHQASSVQRTTGLSHRT